MGKIKTYLNCVIFFYILFIYIISPVYGQSVKIGAYYFDGWNEKSLYHITDKLKFDFSEREPKWGWITSSQKIMDEQLLLAKSSGISFFSFCWYNDATITNRPLNDALKYYQKSPNRKNFQFSLLVANHEGFELEPEEWDSLTDRWLNFFRMEDYFRIEHCPLISFFSVKSMIKKFGSTDNVKFAMERFRSKARIMGFRDIKLAACVPPSKTDVEQAIQCGFNVLTGYNYHDYGLYKSKIQRVPLDAMRTAERKIWNEMRGLSNVEYIPAITLNWDPRPWANNSNGYETAPFFIGYSSESVYNSVKSYRDWALEKPENSKVAILYAWNEYGEGAYLTPTKKGLNLLMRLKKAIN